MWDQFNSFSRQLKEQATHAAKEAGIDINLKTMGGKFANSLTFDDLTSKVISFDHSNSTHSYHVFNY